MALANGLTNPVASRGMANTLVCVAGTVAVGTAGLALNAVTPLVRVPKGFTLIHATLEATDMDTNASPTLVLAVGDTGLNNRILTGLTIGQTGGINSVIAATGHQYRYPDETTINLTATAGAATAAAGTVQISLLGVIDA
ncbi:MAG: hypothetical protein ING71_16710 [Rhodocyclaceae bacterium]|nr:hypothetical protein [Rhodocyclaceae bacterium]